MTQDFKLDFAIVGFPRSGTTSLAAYLAAHPQVGFCKVKEPRYWNPDCYTREAHRIRTWEAYVKLFPKEGLHGEATPELIYSKEGLKRLKEHNPDIKIIVIVRDPDEMLYSWKRLNESAHHSTLLGENLRNTAKALENLAEAGLYRNMVMLSFHIMVREPIRSYKSALKHLGLHYDGRTEFPVLNKGRKPFKLRLLARRHTPDWLYWKISAWRWKRYVTTC